MLSTEPNGLCLYVLVSELLNQYASIQIIKNNVMILFQKLTGPIYQPIPQLQRQNSSNLAVHKQSFHSIAKCIAALTITCPNEGSSVVNQFVSDIKVSLF